MNVPSVPVLIVPCTNHVSGREHGVYTVRRGIPPFEGRLALPGGFHMHYRPVIQETWQEAGCREVHEEIQVICNAEDVSLLDAQSSYNADRSIVGDRNLIIGYVSAAVQVEPFEQTSEAEGRVVLFPDDEAQLCFPIHRKALAMYWDQKGVAHNVRP